MNTPVEEIQSALFEGISVQDRRALLGCMGYRVRTFPKGSFVAMEDEKINQIGIILSGTVDMVKEDLWGNRTMLLRMKKNEVFGETFACGDHGNSTVTFVASQTAEILFLPFCRVTRCCTNSCEFHHRLSDNLVGIMATNQSR